MKTHSLLISVALAFTGVINGTAQNSFLNLDFEMAEITPEQDFTNAFPGWHGIAGGVAASTVQFNRVLLDSPQIGLWDANADESSGLPQPLFGAFSAYLMADEGPWPSPDAGLAQTGIVPSDARSIRFATTPDSVLPNPDLRPEHWQLHLLFDGQSVPYVELESNANFILWGADVADYAGQTVELRFRLHTAFPPNSPPPFDVGVAIGLDEILFSPQPIPEPGPGALLAICSVGLVVWMMRRTKSAATAGMVAVSLGTPGVAVSQSGFNNLDFEMAQISSGQEFTNAFPYWNGLVAGSAASNVIYNRVLLDSPQIGIWDTNASDETDDLPPPLFGAWSAYLMADTGGAWGSTNGTAQLAQTGVVPTGSKSIRFATTPGSVLHNPGLSTNCWQLQLLLDGQDVSYVQLASQTNFTLWGADVSGYAGQTVELQFRLATAMPTNSPPPYDVGVAIGLDNIEFSTTEIP